MGEDFKKILKEIKENHEATLESLIGGKVIKRIQPDERVGIMNCFIFDNGLVLELGVPLYVHHLGIEVSANIDYERKHPFKILESYDIYNIGELKERLEEEKNPHRIAYMEEILEIYNESGG